MEASLSQIIGAVVKPLVVNVTKHVGYVTSCATHVSDMKRRMQHLESTSIDVNKRVDSNKINSLEVPARVHAWFQDVEKIKKDVERILSNDIGCCNMKTRYEAGKEALRVYQQINSLISETSKFNWETAKRPPARVESKSASTSAAPPSGGDNTQNVFSSRNVTFNESLKLLQQEDDTTRVIGLCGMGGVGKTTMMEQLKKVAEDKKMFDWIVKVIIGSKPNMYSIQNAVGECTGESLTETTESVRADVLCKRFEKMSENGKKKILVIVDDVWDKFELKGIGLASPLPNGFKLLLTSRNLIVCTQIAVDANLVLQVVTVNVLDDLEARDLFSQITKVTEENDRTRYQIGSEILKKCGGLPLAIKLIAGVVQSQEIYAWKNVLTRLKNNDLDKDVQEIIEISYGYLCEEEKAIFLLCGLFREDSNIPIEDLTRYSWGLRLLKEVSTLRDARNRTHTCVSNLKTRHLLIDGDHNYSGCVKVHDLVLSFVVGKVSRGEDTWIIDHTSNWSEVKTSESCKRISLTCKGKSESPSDLKFPNLFVLKLMQGDDDSLTFPSEFYEEMRQLQVVDYQGIQRPLLSTSFQCSANLRTLSLHECSLMFDLSSIGNLLSLEVLSFANSRIQKLPSTFKNLKKLRLLDLTGCFSLVIEDGVLISLVELEELYMTANYEQKSIRLSEENCNELSGLSKNLSALEIEFFQNIAQPKNVSFEKLERFKISMGCFLRYTRSYENTLVLKTNTCELLESGMNELFEKTEVLHLKVEDMNDLENIEVKSLNSLPQYSSFYNLRVLNVSECVESRYLFTSRVATTLSKLEVLKISSCDNMAFVIHTTDGDRSQNITFLKLKVLELNGLPKILGLCNNVNAIKLPQLEELRLIGLPQITFIYRESKGLSTTFLNKEIVIPKLQKLFIENLVNLKEIWSCESSEKIHVPMLREIEVSECHSLVNLFPINPMTLLQHLQELKVTKCGSLQVLFNIELGFVSEIEQVNSTSKLRKIHITELGKLKEVWRIKGAKNFSLPIHGFQDVETIYIESCECFQNLFTPTTINFDTGALTDISVRNCGQSGKNNGLVKSNEHHEINVIYNEDIFDNTFNVAFPPYVTLNNLQLLSRLHMENIEGVEVVFEIDTPRETQQLLPCLKDLILFEMKSMTHVWKCYNWNGFLIPQKQHFHNLTTINVRYCNSIKYLFSPFMAKHLSNLKRIEIWQCDGMEEVVSNRDDENETMSISATSICPQLHSIQLLSLKNLKHVGSGPGSNETSTLSITDQIKVFEAGVVSWSLCQYSRHIRVSHCHVLSSVIPCYALGQMQKLEVLDITYCKSMREVFETPQGTGGDGGSSINVDEGNDMTLVVIPRPKSDNMLQLPNLKKLKIESCDLLEHIFTFSTLESLRQLEDLIIWGCKAMEVVVTTSYSSKLVVFPRLKSLRLIKLPKLLGFFLGMNDFRWPLLEEVEIGECPQMRVFTGGQSAAPNLKFINTSLGKHSLECGLNFHVTTTLQHQTSSQSVQSRSSPPIILEQLPWSYHNLIEMVVIGRYDVKEMISSNEFVHLQKLEKINLMLCTEVEVVFAVMEALEGTDSNNSNESDTTTTTVFELSNLKEVELNDLDNLKYIWKSNQRTIFKFPNLTRLSICNCNKLEHVISSSMVSSRSANSNKREVELHSLERVKYIRNNNQLTVFKFPNLTTLCIKQCDKLEHVFSSSMVGSLLQLQHLFISMCSTLEVIVKEEEEENGGIDKVKLIEFPHLKSIQLKYLSSLKGFWLGNEAFLLPSLDNLKIVDCPAMTVFTMGDLTTRALKVVNINDNEYYVNKDLNSCIQDYLRAKSSRR